MDSQRHPCFSTSCQPKAGRLHLPVSPFCNIFCRFCRRGISQSEELPGNAMTVMSPGDALGVVGTALRLCPDIRVVGVAGPGEPLAGPEALDALGLVKREHPGLIACLSTNGLMLEASMERLLAAGVEALTVTINALDPETLQRINRGVLSEGVFVGGVKGQGILIAAQERGIKAAAKNSMTIKVNSVLVPGVNDRHIPEIARRAKEWGASMLNVIPLIPSRGLKSARAPSPEEYARVSEEAGRHLPVKGNCRRCRADACGVPGVSDYSREVYGPIAFAGTFSHG
ncbi:MAG: radical SAM protein [Deltaproteobacteria bacterium]|jgi:nitrogen fixation protein NifB|nr:radical SAM protein [Deltaproteobacteria bacterium]